MSLKKAYWPCSKALLLQLEAQKLIGFVPEIEPKSFSEILCKTWPLSAIKNEKNFIAFRKQILTCRRGNYT